MQKLFALKFPSECKTLPEGFWSAVDVWIKKPHVINKRLCGVKEHEEEERETLRRRLLGEPGSSSISPDVCPDVWSPLLSPGQTHGEEETLSCSVRTFIPKVNCYGTKQHKELVVKGE